MLDGLLGDLRLAVRSLRAAPAVTTAAILTLILGIGATTAIFSVANGMVLRPLPVRNPHDLVTVTSAGALRFGFQGGAGWSYAMWERLRSRADAFDGAFAWMLQRMDLSEGGEAQPVTAVVASGDFFQTLGVTPVVGRAFTSADDVRGGGPDGPVVVVSQSLWQRKFNRRVDVVGSRLVVEGTPLTVVGVTPEWFTGVDVGQPFDIAIPFGTEALVRGRRSVTASQRSLLLTVMLRLKPGERPSQATAALHALQPQILGSDAPPFLKEPFVAVDASTGISDRSGLRQRYEFPLVVLAIVASSVLVIVCLNIANLLLARASARKPELSVRRALGASRWRLARQHAIEGLVLASAGTVGGFLFADWASRGLIAHLPLSKGPISISLAIDWRVLMFISAVAFITLVLSGTVPALYAMRVPAVEALRLGGRGGEARSARLFSVLIVVQIGLSLMLLSAAGLFARTLARLVSVPLGFDPDGVLVISADTSRSPVNPSDPTQLSQRMLDAVMATPGVLQAAGSVWVPIESGGGGLLTDARGRRSEVGQQIAYNFVTPGWFETYRTAGSGRA